ncbi:hypothetical protein FACS1894172_06940 [Spirochaetia bacterium]|nr:hypothetical protein FACS1894172_06940 [Spirochaetia bacterium]
MNGVCTIDCQILSVYSDGELPSPWKEDVETHLASCPECTVRLEQLRRCSAFLHTPDSNVQGAQDRVWQRLQNTQPAQHLPIWSRKLWIPLPAVAAAVFVFLFCTALIVRLMAPTPVPAPAEMAMGGVNLNIDSIMSLSGEIGLLQYMENQDSTDTVIMRLPESHSFSRYGEPAIVKASDYSRRPR